MKMTENTILITGATSGIGLGLAEALHARGNKVIIAGRRQDKLDSITARNPRMTGMLLDVDARDALSSFAAQVREAFPNLNVLINNAGISRPETLTEGMDNLAVAEAIVQTNILGVLRMTAELLPCLTRQPRSAIITTTSGLAFVPRAPFPTYCASKAFLHSWLQSLRVQLRDTSVEVLELAPPYVQTALAGPDQETDPRAMPLADYVAEVMERLEAENTPSGEILVERVRQLRTAEASGQYDKIFAMLNG